MSKDMHTYILAIGVALCLIALGSKARMIHLPGNHQDYEPEQPIAFSHRLHAGEMSIDCLYCHFGAEKSRHAGVPAVSTCMNCHSFVSATLGAVQAEDKLATEEGRKPALVISPELLKIYETLGIESLEQKAGWRQVFAERESSAAMESIPWVKIHNLPDFVYFDHRAHVNVGVACQKCHGNVESMERVRQVETLARGWCINCHRISNELGINAKPVHASTDCTTCHY